VVAPLGRRTAASRRFATAYETFFGRLVTTAPEEVLYDLDAFDTLLAWLVALSASRVRPLRHAAVVAAYALAGGVLELRAALRSTTAALQASLAAGGRGGGTRGASPGGGGGAAAAAAAAAAGTRPASAASAGSGGAGGTPAAAAAAAAGRAAVANDRRRKVARAAAKDRDLAALGDHVWQGVVQVRYRDVAPAIRAAAATAIGRWAAAYPSVYLGDERLKLVGWLLNDPAAPVRAAAVAALRPLYARPDVAGSLDTFTGRFGERLVELGRDVDAGVAEAGLRLAADVRRLGVPLVSVGGGGGGAAGGGGPVGGGGGGLLLREGGGGGVGGGRGGGLSR